MKKILFIFLVLLLSFSVCSYEDDDLLSASQAKLYLTINSSFEIQKLSSGYKIDYVSVKLSYLPLESYRQRVVSHITSPKAEEYDDYILYTWRKPPIGSEHFRSEYIMTTGTSFYPIKNKVSFPISEIPKEVIKYTQSTEYIDVNDDINNLANEIAQGKSDLYEIVFDTAIWVNNNIEYDLSTATAQASLPSSWVLNERRGVCDEMTNLFISLLRSLGIPARFVSGISYTNSPLFEQRWGPHGWAEVYFPNYGWVPFDPTYGQYGYVDAGHIKLKESIDSDKSSVDYEWLSYGVNIKGNSPSNKVQVLEKIGIYNPELSLSLESLYEKVGFGSYNVVTATIKNRGDEYRALKLSLVAPKEVTIYEKEKYVLIKPKEEKIIDWKIKFPSNLDKKSTYTFPFSVVSNLNNTAITNLIVRSSSPSLNEEYVDSYMDSRIFSDKELLDVAFSCEHKKTVDANKEVNIECVIGDNSVNVCLDDTCKTPSQGKISFTKTYELPGAYPLIIIAEKGEKQKSYYSQVLVNDKPKIDIDWDDFEKTMNYGDSQNIIFSLKQTSIAVPKQVSIDLEFNNQIRNLVVKDFTDTQLFQFQLKGSELDTGINKISVKATYNDDSGNIYYQEFNNQITMQTNNAFETIIAKINKFLNYLVTMIENMLD